jgi:hypothetical protein
MVTRRDYTAEAVDGALSVLVELTHLLGEYRENIVLIGGWVPDFLFPGVDPPHVGSMDIDLALDHTKITEAGYETIANLLTERGYRPGDQPYKFYRTIESGGTKVEVEVDLLAGEYEGTGRGRRHQRVQDIKARKARGCDLAFDMFEEISVTGTLPGGGKDTVTLRVASVVSFLVMKGMALEDRIKEKDAWDIYHCLRSYPGGLVALIAEIKPHISNNLVREGFEKIGTKFASIEHIGPQWVANFDEIDDSEERDLRVRDAFERVDYLLRGLGLR